MQPVDLVGLVVVDQVELDQLSAGGHDGVSFDPQQPVAVVVEGLVAELAQRDPADGRHPQPDCRQPCVVVDFRLEWAPSNLARV